MRDFKWISINFRRSILGRIVCLWVTDLCLVSRRVRLHEVLVTTYLSGRVCLVSLPFIVFSDSSNLFLSRLLSWLLSGFLSGFLSRFLWVSLLMTTSVFSGVTRSAMPSFSLAISYGGAARTVAKRALFNNTLFFYIFFLSLPLLMPMVQGFWDPARATILLLDYLLLAHLLLDLLLWVFLPFSPFFDRFRRLFDLFLDFAIRSPLSLCFFFDNASLFLFLLTWDQLLLFSELLSLLLHLWRCLLSYLLGSLLRFLLLSFIKYSLMALRTVLYEGDRLYIVGYGLLDAINFS